MPLRHYHRKLDAGFVALPQMTGRRFGMPFILSPPTLTLRFRQNNGPTPSGGLPALAFALHGWQRWREITINDIRFRLPKPCSRCPVPTINTETAARSKEPLKTLNRLRRWNNHVYFGQNALHDNIGELSIGSDVKINLTGTKQPPL